MVYSRYYHRRKILNMMENVLPIARLLLTQMRANYDHYYKNRNFCNLLERKINFIEEGMRHRRLCANEEYLKIDDDDHRDLVIDYFFGYCQQCNKRRTSRSQQRLQH